MKPIYIILAWCVAFGSIPLATHGQTWVNETYDELDQLDHSGMQTDVLFNRAFLSSELIEDWATGAPINSTTQWWLALYQGLNASTLYGTQSPAPFNDSLAARYTTLPLDGSAPSIGLGMILMEGDYITSASMDSMLVDSTAQPVYDHTTLFATAPLADRAYNGTVIFLLSPSLLKTNINGDINGFSIDFGNGLGFQSYSLVEQVIPITYSSEGEKAISIRAHVNDTVYEAHTQINIKALDIPQPTEESQISVVINDTTRGRSAQLNQQVVNGHIKYLEGIDGKLDKPVLFLEGFDLLGTQNWLDLYINWRDEIRELRQNGYDVYLVTFVNSGLDIRQNAQIVKQQIKRINQNKTGNFEGVLVGESMGGLIGRIALKQLENEGYQHNIGLYVSLDAPHKGANIPVGFQYLVHEVYKDLPGYVKAISYLTEIFEGILNTDIPYIDTYQQLTSAAAQQMIVRHFMGNGQFNAMQSYLNALGYPAQTRNITLANGSGTGQELSGVTLGEKQVYFKLAILRRRWSGEAWTSKTNTTNQLVASYKHYRKRFRGGRKYFVNEAHRYTFDNKAYDSAPAGIREYTGGRKNWIIEYGVDVNFSFLPTVSAIALSQSIINTGDLDYLGGTQSEAYILDNDLSPFDDIYADDDNNRHIDHDDFSLITVIRQEIMYHNMYLQNRDITTHRDFESANFIQAGHNVDAYTYSDKRVLPGDFVVNNGRTVNLTAGNEVILSPGFHAKNGSTVTIKANGTNPNPLRTQTSPAPSAPTITGPRYVCEGGTLKAKAQSNATYNWSLTAANQTITGSGPTFSIPAGLPVGQYMVNCTASTANGEAAATKVVVVPASGQCELRKDMTTLPAVEELQMKVYPNPSTGTFNLKLSQALEGAQVLVHNLHGQVVHQGTMETTDYTMNLNSLSTGIYVLTVTGADLKLTERIIIE